MLAVTSWRSKSVRPQEGHETKSVLVLRMREPCSMPKEVLRRKFTSLSGLSSITPSPSPSTSSAPATDPPWITTWSLSSSAVNTRWWITGMLHSCFLRMSKTRREACTRLLMCMLSSSFTASDPLRTASSASLSVPSAVTATRCAPSGSSTFPPAAANSLRETTATELGRGLAWRAAMGASTPTLTSCRRFSVRRASASSAGGTSRRKMESEVAMSLKGMPTTSLHASSL
mmetsp:Transcript_38199/g.83083  ORF Transcript_38199/g.83083 Transcript_38199/m.83083 type:complete len:230 (-) Transcript_38199:1341-2030(-)